MIEKISVLLVDDHAVVRAGYKTYLTLSEKIGTIYEADRGESACQLYSEYRPDVVVLDISMPGMGGFEAMRRMVNRDTQCKILVFSIHDELVFMTRAIKAGAKGYIIKNSEPEILTEAVCAIAKGGSYIEPKLAQKLALSVAIDGIEERSLKSLTPREFDVFCLLAKGLTTREASEKLRLSYKTVANYHTSIKEKLALKTVAEMALLASREGIIKTGHEKIL
ncbi:MAG: response regulator transcription factor [Methyloprofundus sp.]|nr:response regulator transcription factor [Methyloprofundus sp.]